VLGRPSRLPASTLKIDFVITPLSAKITAKKTLHC
jgi:hypothetical protein